MFRVFPDSWTTKRSFHVQNGRGGMMGRERKLFFVCSPDMLVLTPPRPLYLLLTFIRGSTNPPSQCPFITHTRTKKNVESGNIQRVEGGGTWGGRGRPRKHSTLPSPPLPSTWPPNLFSSMSLPHGWTVLLLDTKRSSSKPVPSRKEKKNSLK